MSTLLTKCLHCGRQIHVDWHNPELDAPQWPPEKKVQVMCHHLECSAREQWYDIEYSKCDSVPLVGTGALGGIRSENLTLPLG
jgi:hypothetical protein